MMVKKKKITFLPDFVEGENVTFKDINPKQHFTQPPPSYTEATSSQNVRKTGIGRPSTYAPTLDTIQPRGYVTLRERRSFRLNLAKLSSKF